MNKVYNQEIFASLMKEFLFLQLVAIGRDFAPGAALEAPVGPQVLLGTATHRAFNPLVDANAVGFVALTGEIVERWMNHQAVATAVGQALLGERHHQRLAQPGELAGGGHRRGLDAEQRHEDALLGAVVLVGRIPDGAPRAQ